MCRPVDMCGHVDMRMLAFVDVGTNGPVRVGICRRALGFLHSRLHQFAAVVAHVASMERSLLLGPNHLCC